MPDRILSCSAALAEALNEEMTRDPAVFIIGEDIRLMREYSASSRASRKIFRTVSSTLPSANRPSPESVSERH